MVIFLLASFAILNFAFGFDPGPGVPSGAHFFMSGVLAAQCLDCIGDKVAGR